jgi:hypothetical protein
MGDQVASMLGFLDQEILLDSPFIATAHQSFQMLNLPPLQRVPTSLLLCFPPHVDLSSSICLDLLSPDVNSMPCEITENCFQDFWKQNYPQQVQIYTAGSCSATGSVSAGLYLPSTNLATGWLLNWVHTILGAELFAILKAMQLTTIDVSLKDKPILILTNSRAALQILSSLSVCSYCSIIAQIHIQM